MLYYFILTVCLANLTCNEETYLFRNIEVTESCEKETRNFQDWYKKGSKNSQSDKLTYKISCHIIKEGL